MAGTYADLRDKEAEAILKKYEDTHGTAHPMESHDTVALAVAAPPPFRLLHTAHPMSPRDMMARAAAAACHIPRYGCTALHGLSAADTSLAAASSPLLAPPLHFASLPPSPRLTSPHFHHRPKYGMANIAGMAPNHKDVANKRTGADATQIKAVEASIVSTSEASAADASPPAEDSAMALASPPTDEASAMALALGLSSQEPLPLATEASPAVDATDIVADI